MNYKNFYPRQDIKSKLPNNNRRFESFPKNTGSQNFNRKADFHFSDNENEDLPVYNDISTMKEGNMVSKNSSDNFLSENKSVYKNIVLKRTFDKVNFNAPSGINSKICYGTNEEKLKLLDELDSYVRKRNYQGLERPLIAGTCLDMCPEKERYLREHQDNVSIFERNENNQFDHRKAVKEYERCSIDQKESQPHDLRPTEILQRTMNYLLTQIADIDDEKVSWRQWYRFLWDRTRSIRKDITQQNLCNTTVVNIIETITRFHIFCGACFCEEPQDTFDPKMNDDHLKNCLQTLKDMYADMPADSCVNEPEFRSYMIVLNLDKGETFDEAQKLTSRVFQSSKLTFAIHLCQAISTNNYVRFFRLLEQSDFILSCLLHRFIVPMRLRAIEVINKAYVTNKSTENKVNQFPLSTIFRQLKFENNDEIIEFCFSVNQKLTTVAENQMIILNYQNLNLNKKQDLIRRSVALVESKQSSQKLSVIFDGNKKIFDSDDDLPACKMVSFDENGFYIGKNQVPWKSEIPIKFTEQADSEVICLDSSEEDHEEMTPSDNINSPYNTSICESEIIDNQTEKSLPLSKSTVPKPSLFNIGSSQIRNNIFSINSGTVNLFDQNKNTAVVSSSSNVSRMFFNNINTQASKLIFNTNENLGTSSNLNFLQSQPPKHSSSEWTRKLPYSATNLPTEPEIVVRKEPSLSKEERSKFAAAIYDLLISDFTNQYLKVQCTKIFENETFKHLEIIKMYENLILDLTKEAVKDVTVQHNNNIRFVVEQIREDLISDSIDELKHEIIVYVNNKKKEAKMRTQYQMKYYFQRWHQHSQEIIKSRKSLINLRAVPRMIDDFVVCENLRGKVRKISTEWFESRDAYWKMHPIIARLEQITETYEKPKVSPEKRVSSSQTILSYYNKKFMSLCDFIKTFIKCRFLDVLDAQLEVLNLACKIDPSPGVIVSDYNSIINEMVSVIPSQMTSKQNIFGLLKLPVVDINDNIQKYDQELFEKILTDLDMLCDQKNSSVTQANEIFEKLNINQQFSYFHFRLLPWISIIKKAVLNKLKRVDEISPGKTFAVETSQFSVTPRLQLESIVDNLSVQQCLNECIMIQNDCTGRQQRSPTPIVQKSVLAFKNISALVCKLQEKINECKENNV